jgi:hypothetical protein
MKAACSMAFGLVVMCALVLSVRADEKPKAETLKGTITCAKCDLGIADDCATVIKVKDTVYFFDAKGDKKFHKEICKKGKEGSVTGTVSEKDKKKTVTVTEAKFDK